MRILVTGGAGFIGSNLVHHLLGRQGGQPAIEADLVVNVDKLTYAGSTANLSDIMDDPKHVFVEGDITDKDFILNLLREHKIDSVMHLAAESHVDRSIDTPEPFLTTNVLGTLRMLEAAREYHKENANFKFLHVSTDEVYGSLELDDPAFSETTSYSPNSPYSASKAASDHFVRAYFHTYGLPVVTTNCSNNYGPRQFPEKLVPLMIRKAIKGEKLPVYGDGSQIRDWLHVDDHARGLTTVLAKGRLGEVYNIGGLCEMKNLNTVRAIISAVNQEQPDSQDINVDDQIEFVKDRPGHDQRYAIDCTKIESELGWQPLETFESGMQKTVRWYLDNEEWINQIEGEKYQGERLGVKA